jgi:hypothetical protein
VIWLHPRGGAPLANGNTLGSYGIDHESEVTVTMTGRCYASFFFFFKKKGGILTFRFSQKCDNRGKNRLVYSL